MKHIGVSNLRVFVCTLNLISDCRTRWSLNTSEKRWTAFWTSPEWGGRQECRACLHRLAKAGGLWTCAGLWTLHRQDRSFKESRFKESRFKASLYFEASHLTIWTWQNISLLLTGLLNPQQQPAQNVPNAAGKLGTIVKMVSVRNFTRPKVSYPQVQGSSQECLWYPNKSQLSLYWPAEGPLDHQNQFAQPSNLLQTQGGRHVPLDLWNQTCLTCLSGGCHVPLAHQMRASPCSELRSVAVTSAAMCCCCWHTKALGLWNLMVRLQVSSFRFNNSTMVGHLKVTNGRTFNNSTMVRHLKVKKTAGWSDGGRRGHTLPSINSNCHTSPNHVTGQKRDRSFLSDEDGVHYVPLVQHKPGFRHSGLVMECWSSNGTAVQNRGIYRIKRECLCALRLSLGLLELKFIESKIESNWQSIHWIKLHTLTEPVGIVPVFLHGRWGAKTSRPHPVFMGSGLGTSQCQPCQHVMR